MQRWDAEMESPGTDTLIACRGRWSLACRELSIETYLLRTGGGTIIKGLTACQATYILVFFVELGRGLQGVPPSKAM